MTKSEWPQRFLKFLSIFYLQFVVVIYMTSERHPVICRSETEEYFVDPVSSTKKRFPSLSAPAELQLSVIVPAYNEQERLPKMMDECLDYLEARRKESEHFQYEVIVVDDGSSDKTTEVALKYSHKFGTDKVRVLTFEKNRGKGGAVRLGMMSSRGEHLLFADADGASSFPDYSKVEMKMRKICDSNKTNEAIVCGSRAHLQDEAVATRSLFRTLLMHGFHFMVWLLCVRGIRDTQCGFKLLTRQAARSTFSNLHVERWAFDVELLYIAQTLGIPIGEVAINWKEIDGSKMVPVWSWLQMGRDLLLIRFRYLIGAWQLKEKEL
ncbi:PREDICTED: dolichyl-phosphate beta-glucosyltransferase-like [Priapulus caudatus]|uniref:dolichyl-phosphate beta-glucosyltransferase n=1 Tax=Priapulus caudatus TaxID=37621 RepID=A0ABM1DQ40_PRICU|nr:PREDICTED: dolichyl-phosphate beta-glucosyltransferase-like [Priapulus caudatus]